MENEISLLNIYNFIFKTIWLGIEIEFIMTNENYF